MSTKQSDTESSTEVKALSASPSQDLDLIVEEEETENKSSQNKNESVPSSKDNDDDDDDEEGNGANDANGGNALKKKRRKRSEDSDTESAQPLKKKKKSPLTKNSDEVYKVNEIAGWRYVNGSTLFNVAWEGTWDADEAKSWEPISNVARNDKFQDFVLRIQTKLVQKDEGGLLQEVNKLSGLELKEILLEKLDHGDDYDKVALDKLFNINSQ